LQQILNTFLDVVVVDVVVVVVVVVVGGHGLKAAFCYRGDIRDPPVQNKRI
jgi:hypothetical protein